MPLGGVGMRLLLAEDDPGIVSLLTDYLRAEGFEVEAVSGQAAAELRLESGRCALALVDLALSDGDGFGVCRAAKARGIPVIFLTASADESSVVSGLDMGADDYVSKPFRPRELCSRIRSVLRRSGKSRSVLEYGALTVDLEKGAARKNDCELNLSALEYRLLLVLFNHRGELISRDRLLQELWELSGEYVNDNTLTVYIKRLREKLEDDPQHPVLIRTVRGQGYRLGEPDEAPA